MSRSHIALLALAVAAAATFFAGLGRTTLIDANESFYAETPREMLESGDYVNPSFNYQPRFNKPPLSYWAVAGVYHLFGVSEGVARIPIALGAVTLIATAYALGRLVFDWQAGLIGALVLATSPRFLMVARRIIIDVYVTMFMGLTLVFFVAAELRPDRRRMYLVAMYVSAALGFLTKGPVAIVLPALSFLLYLAAYGRLGRWREMMPGTGLVIVALIVAPWYGAVYWQHGWTYISAFFLEDNLQRFTTGYGAPTPERGWFFYIPVLLGTLFPWSLVLAVALGWRISYDRPRHEPGRGEAARSAAATLLAIWTLSITAFFSLSAAKQELYILPVVPAAAALVGGLLATLLAGRGSTYATLGRGAIGLVGLLLGVTGAAAAIFLGTSETPFALAGLTAAASVAAAGGLATAWLAFRKQDFGAVGALALATTIAQWVFVGWILPDFERYKPIRPLAAEIRSRADAGARVGHYRFASPSLVFYLRRPIFEYQSETELVKLFGSPGEIYCIMTAAEYNAVGARLPAPSYVLARRPILDVRLPALLGDTPTSDVLLVSNRPAAVR